MKKRSKSTKILGHKKFTKLAACISAMTFSFALTSDADVKNNAFMFQNSETTEFIVKFKQDDKVGIMRAEQIESRLTALSSTYGTTMQFERSLASGAQLVSVAGGASQYSMDELIVNMQSDQAIEYAVPNYRLYTMAVPNDPQYNEQWHYYEETGGINMPPAWDITEGGGAVVAVIDTGYRPHVDLAPNIIQGYDFISDPSTARDNNGRDSDASDEGDWFGFFECGTFFSQPSSWHGTHVAGTIAAVNDNGIGVAGIAPDAKVVPVRALGKCGGTLADIQDGMLWAAGVSVSGVPDNENPADVINMSLGGGTSCDAAMQDVVDQVNAAGSLIVAAAGNSNANASSFTPAGCDGVLTVASTTRTGSRASYSNFGSSVEVAAPGGQTSNGPAFGVLSTLNSGPETPEDDIYSYYQGTSMAAPHVAGVAALLFAQKPDATPQEVTDVLMDTAREFPGTCSQCGTGIVDAHAALLAIGGGSSNNPPSAGFDFSAEGLSVSFSDDSSDRDGNVVSWSWSFGDGASSSQQDPSHTYGAAGSYTVSLTVTDDDGASDTVTQTVSVAGGNDNTPPSAAFDFTTDNLSVSFSDESGDSDGSVVSWSWDFGDGASSSQQSPTYSYRAAGVYTVTLTVTDNDGATSSASQSVEVSEAPAGDISLEASVSSFWIFHTISLSWDGSSATNVDIYKNGSVVSTTANDGGWSESVIGFGSATYQVCDAGTQNCSNEADVQY